MIKVRRAVREDVDAMADLLALLFAQEAEFTPDHEAQSAALANIVSNADQGFALVAEGDGDYLGMVSILYTLSTALGGRVGILEDMIVAPAARGARVGEALLERAIAMATDEGCLRVTLLTDADNDQAQRFYERHGFSASAMRVFRRFPPTP
ncbi:MAG: GNAT family N-acetyltransferase [Gammaproteobacteria bacterium]|nr:GNAT family N-acetyltransferase [Gammaproteobacteria bacterium]NNL99285.1 GNAT family N-acetyltransferase [Gammaproteobacteria bacterium]